LKELKMNNSIQITGISNAESYPKCAPSVPSQQICETDKLYIPIKKLPMESILHVYANISVCSFDIICTPAGRKLIIEGMKHIKVIYVADEPCQSVHSAHFDIPFCMFVLLRGFDWEVCGAFAAIEDVKVRQLSPRCFWISTIIFACPDIDRASCCCRNDGCSNSWCDDCGFIKCDDCGCTGEHSDCDYESGNCECGNDSCDCGCESDYNNSDCSNEHHNCGCNNECDSCEKSKECVYSKIRDEKNDCGIGIKDEFSHDVERNKLGVRKRKYKYGVRKNKKRNIFESMDELVPPGKTNELPEENLTERYNDILECIIGNECKYCLNKSFCKRWKGDAPKS